MSKKHKSSNYKKDGLAGNPNWSEWNRLKSTFSELEGLNKKIERFDSYIQKLREDLSSKHQRELFLLEQETIPNLRKSWKIDEALFLIKEGKEALVGDSSDYDIDSEIERVKELPIVKSKEEIEKDELLLKDFFSRFYNSPPSPSPSPSLQEEEEEEL